MNIFLTSINNTLAPSMHLALRAMRVCAVSMLLIGGQLLTDLGRASNAVQAQQEIDCANNPFGRVIDAGGEKELFVSLPHYGTSPKRELDLYKLDRDPNSSIAWQEAALDIDIERFPDNVNHETDSLAAADVDGNNDAEIVQAYRGPSGSMEVVLYNRIVGAPFTNDTAKDRWSGTNAGLINHTKLAVAAGDLATDNIRDEEIVVASRNSDGNLHLVMLNGTKDNVISTLDNFYVGRFVGDPVRDAVNIAVGVGNLDGTRDKHEVAVAYINDDGMLELVVLEYDFSHQPAGSLTFALKKIDSHIMNIPDPQHVRMALADIDGDRQDEVVLVTDTIDNHGGSSDSVHFKTFDIARNSNGGLNFTERVDWQYQVGSTSIALAAGDVDVDGNDEVIFGFIGDRDNTDSGVFIEIFDAEAPGLEKKFVRRGAWFDGRGLWRLGYSLSLAAGDFDKDGRDDIFSVFHNERSELQVTQYIADKQPDPFDPDAQGSTQFDNYQKGVEVSRMFRTQRLLDNSSEAPQIVVADWDNDSIWAVYDADSADSLTCRKVVEPQIVSTVYVPPFWPNLYPTEPNPTSGSIGESKDKSKSESNSMSTFTEHSVSAYIGGAVDAGVVEVSAKVTAGYRNESGYTKSDSTTEGQQQTVAWSNSFDFAVVQESEYFCYQYGLEINNVPIDGHARPCEIKKQGEKARSLDVWDNRHDEKPTQWIPVVRNWASLTLFKGASTSQSTTYEDWTADRAVDNNRSGNQSDRSMSHTDASDPNQPWWQINLGQVEEIHKIRIWNRTDIGCSTPSDGVCAKRLHDFYIFISETDFAKLPSDAESLHAHEDVYSIPVPGEAFIQTTRQTLENGQTVKGRYVRIQLDAPGILTLAEVQVFGPSQTDPDRYPRKVKDDSTEDGTFEAHIFNPITQKYEWVDIPGSLEWNEGSDDLFGSKFISQGDSIFAWSMSDYVSNTTERSETEANSASVGAEIDVESGAFAKMQFGGGYEFSTGLTSEESRTTTLGESFELGGAVKGFPSEWKDDLGNCEYSLLPYYYWTTNTSEHGYEHRYLVVDYIVPDSLNRAADLSKCRKDRTMPDNKAPVAGDDSVSVDPDSTNNRLDVLVNDTDPNSTALTITSVVQPSSSGSVAIIEAGKALAFTPAAGFTGQVIFNYTISDGALTAVGAVTVDVQAQSGVPTNGAPEALAQTVTTVQDEPVTFLLLATDVDGNPLTYEIVSGPSNGTVVAADGVFMVTYTPAVGFVGEDSFLFNVNDGTVDSSVAKVTIQVNDKSAPVNTPPVAQEVAVSVSGTDISVILSGSDTDGDELLYTFVTQPENGTLSGTAPNLTFTPTPGFEGTVNFTYKVNDGTVDSAPATVTINVTATAPPNSAPTGTAQTVNATQGTAKSITLSGTDADSDALTYTVVTQPTNGTVTISGVTATYTPNQGFTGSDSFTYKVNDGTVDSAPATVTVNVTAESQPNPEQGETTFLPLIQ